ncbi:hypothetical protein B0H19DRAFT_126341 [Mycena capillaripes]|nr:hypothetical protein B0H19DRAFT_126341 [Mycena capillaripes]
MLVSRRVKIWVEPFMYHCLVFSRANNWERLKQMIASKPPDFLARHVMSICMPLSTVTMQEASEILAACTGVQRLACWIDHRAMVGTTSTEAGVGIPQSVPIHTLALRRLSIELSHFLSFPTDIPALDVHLTHLELVYWDAHTAYYPATVDLARFPHLTHLALRSDTDRFQWSPQMVASTIATCHRLKVVVLMDYTIGLAEYVRRHLHDPRAVLVLSEVALQDWEPMAKAFHEWEIRLGRKDMWARGEDIIRRNLPT